MYIIRYSKYPRVLIAKTPKNMLILIYTPLFEPSVRGSLCCIRAGKGTELIYQNSISSMSLMSVQWGYFRQTERQSKFGRPNNT